MYEESELYLHIIARAFLFRPQKFRTPICDSRIYSGWDLIESFREWYEIKRDWWTLPDGTNPPVSSPIRTRPDVFFSSIWEYKPAAVFHSCPDENYADLIISWAKLLKFVESMTGDEVKTLTELIIKYGKRYPESRNTEDIPNSFCELQLSERLSLLRAQIRAGQIGGGKS